jgi:hypothetical protein
MRFTLLLHLIHTLGINAEITIFYIKSNQTSNIVCFIHAYHTA